jgi:hypothetical protein
VLGAADVEVAVVVPQSRRRRSGARSSRTTTLAFSRYESEVNRTAAATARNAEAVSSRAVARRSSMLLLRIDIHDASAENDSSVDTWEASTDEEGPIRTNDYVVDE